MGTCPECDENFDIEEGIDVGDIVVCPKCRKRWELLDYNPMLLDEADGEGFEEG